MLSKRYFWIVATDDSWFKFYSLEMQQTDCLSGKPVRHGRGLAADWHLGKRFEDQHYLAESSFCGVHLKRKWVFVDWKSLKINLLKVFSSAHPQPLVHLLGHPPLVETGSLPQVQWWASWVGAAHVDSWNIFRWRARKKNSSELTREELYGPETSVVRVRIHLGCVALRGKKKGPKVYRPQAESVQLLMLYGHELHAAQALGWITIAMVQWTWRLIG